MEIIKQHIREIPDFPKPGIGFKDITPLLGAPEAFAAAIDAFAERYRDAGITKIAAIESRGFLFATPLAQRLGCGVVPVRKPGKLPAETISVSYELEYGQDTLEMHRDALNGTDKVLVMDDLLATGGTLEAALRLVEKLGARVHEAAVVVELAFLDGRGRLGGHGCFALVEY